MKRQIFIGLFMMLILAFSVSAHSINVTDDITLSFDGLEKQSTLVSVSNTDDALTPSNITVTTSISAFTANGFTIPTEKITVSTIPTLENDTSADATITVDLVGTDTPDGKYEGYINFTNGTKLNKYTLILEVDRDMLVFDELEWETVFPRSEEEDDNDDEDLRDGETINVGAGTVLIISGEVINVFGNEPGTEIVDIEVFLNIDDVDEGDDYEEDINLDDLESDDDDSFEFVVDIAYDEFDDNERISAELYVIGEDENRKKYGQKIIFELKFEKEDEEVTIMDAYVLDESVTCKDSTTLMVELKNTGEDDLLIKDDNWASLHIFSTELDLSESMLEIEIDEEDKKVIEYEVDLSDVAPGSYSINIDARVDEADEESDYTRVYFKVNECVTTTTQAAVTTTVAPTTTTIPVVVNNSGDDSQGTGTNYADGPTGSTTVVQKGGISDSNTYVVLLIVLIVVLLIVGGIMVAYLMKK